MLTLNRSSLPAAACALLLAACASPFGGPGGPGGGKPGDFGGINCKSVVDQSRAALAESFRTLALTPRQVVLWEDYEASVQALVNDQIHLQTSGGGRRSAVQQIDAKTAALRRHLVYQEASAASAATLYLSLDEAQKRIADQQLAATVPDLYAATHCQSGNSGERAGGGRGGPGGGQESGGARR